MKIILEGDFTITLLDDQEAGKTVKAGPGDVFYFEKGSRIRFETAGGGLAFYVGQVS